MGVLRRFLGAGGPVPGGGPGAANGDGNERAYPAAGDRGADGTWRTLGPMPRAVPDMAPVVQFSRFEASLTTRSQPMCLAPLAHDRSPEYPSGIAAGIAV